MAELIEANQEQGNTSGVVPFDDAQLDLYFKMYNKVNEKNEEISKSYKNNILINFEDVEELHYKIMQSIRSANPQKGSCIVHIIVSHHEGEAERFKSFEEFKSHNKTSPNPTAEIVLTYKFSTYCKESNQIENYKIQTVLKSRIGELNQFEKEAPAFISSAIISGLVTTTARIRIEYSDYVKARHFTAMFDEWIKGCNESREVKWINKIKRVSHLISRFGRLIIIGLLGYFVSKSIGSEDFSIVNFSRFIVLYSSLFFIVNSISELCLKKLEISIDSHLSLSYLNINKGDAKLIDSFSTRNRKAIAGAVLGTLGAFVVGIASSASYDFLSHMLNQS